MSFRILHPPHRQTVRTVCESGIKPMQDYAECALHAHIKPATPQGQRGSGTNINRINKAVCWQVRCATLRLSKAAVNSVSNTMKRCNNAAHTCLCPGQNHADLLLLLTASQHAGQASSAGDTTLQTQVHLLLTATAYSFLMIT